MSCGRTLSNLFIIILVFQWIHISNSQHWRALVYTAITLEIIRHWFNKLCMCYRNNWFIIIFQHDNSAIEYGCTIKGWLCIYSEYWLQAHLENYITNIAWQQWFSIVKRCRVSRSLCIFSKGPACIIHPCALLQIQFLSLCPIKLWNTAILIKTRDIVIWL